MNILFITPSYKPAVTYGGTIVVVALLAEQLVKLGHTVTVYTTTANGPTELDVEPGKEVLVDGVRVTYFKRITGDHTHVSVDLWKHLNKTVKKFDIVHIHSWWNLLVIGAAAVCKRNGVKPVLSPHGMFSNYILDTNNSFKKKVIHNLAGKYLLKNTYLHVSTQLEWDESVAIIPSWTGEIIPNLVILSAKIYPRFENDVFTVGFLSRVDPKKGLDILITALSKVKFNYRLKVAGSGEEEYVNNLKKLSVTLGNNEMIDWVGWKNGEDKFSYLSQLDLFALTSHSENFAIVIIESLSVGTPVLITENVGLFQYVANNNYGWVSDMKVENIVSKLNLIYDAAAERKRINTTVPNLVQPEFDQANLAQKYFEFYQSISA